MSADKKMDINVATEHGPIHSFVRMWAAKVREQPAVRMTREDLIAALQDDPKMAEAVTAIQQNVPKGAVMFLVGAESGTQNTQSMVEISVRFG